MVATDFGSHVRFEAFMQASKVSLSVPEPYRLLESV